jgi:hypothetical protein
MANPAAAAQPRTRRGAVTARPAARRRSRRHHGAPPRARWRRVPAPATACDRLRPPRPPRPPRLLPASGLPTTRQLRPPARGCWAGAGADAAPSRRGLLVPCACSAAGRPAAPSPPLAWCCAAAAGFAMARVARRATTDRLGSAQTRVSTGAPRAAALAAAPAAARSCAPARPALGVTMRATQVLRMPAWYRGHRQEGTTY